MKRGFNLNSEIEKEDKSKIIDGVYEKLEKEKTMNLSIKEGAASSVMSGLGVSYVSLYGLALNANNAQIGLLSSIPGLLSPITQIFSSKLMEKFSRKNLIVFGVAFQALMWLPILFLSFLFEKNLFLEYLPIFLIIFYSFYAIFGAIASPSWFSLMGDLVPEKIRGKYFGKRNKITETIALISMLIGAFVLDFFKTKGIILIGFSILFFISCIARLISAKYFTEHYEPELKTEKGYYFTIWQFLKKSTSNNFGRFVIFVALINFATMISSPFFAVYMKSNLGFSYATFTFVTLAASVSSILFMPVWGKFSDKYGNRKLMKIGGFLIPLIPILWLFSKSAWYLALVPQFVSGFGWAAFNLAASNFIYDSVTPQRRAICVTYYNVIVGVGTFFGATIGGFLAQYLMINFMNKLLFIFLISGIARFIIFAVMFPMIKEVRKVKRKENFISYLKEIKPHIGIINELTHISHRVNKKIFGN